jgi:putative flippase GtrA
MPRQNKTRKEVTRFTEYLLSGGAYFWSGYATFFFIDKILQGSFFWAKSVSTIFGWTVNFLLQRYWVFNNPKLKRHQTEVTSRYIIITLVDFVLDYLIVYGLKRMGITPYIGQFVSAGFFTVWNYFWYRFWVFPDKFKKTRNIRLVAHRPHGHSAYLKRA